MSPPNACVSTRSLSQFQDVFVNVYAFDTVYTLIKELFVIVFTTVDS